MSDSIDTKTLDHIVHLTPPGTVDETSEQFRKLGFKVIPGGTHANGLTANALVVFADGVYLELISFIHPASHYPLGSPEREERDSHYWASKSPGWIDYSFLGNGSERQRISDVINDRGKKDGSGIIYSAEEAGGRTRPDGNVLKWLISAPPPDKRGTLPFFCGDVTARDLRVPTDPPSNTEHPSAARGISYIRILTASDTLMQLSRQITSAVGDPPISSTDNEVIWLLDDVHQNGKGPRLILNSPASDDEAAFVVTLGAGIYEVAFRVGHGKEGGNGTTPYGKIVCIPEV